MISESDITLAINSANETTRMHIPHVPNLPAPSNNHFGCRLPETPTRQFLLIAALLVALCTTDLSAAPLSDAEVVAMLAAHNAVRRRVAQAESLRLGGTVSIPDLTWDPAVAAVAQQWADSLINNNPPTGGHREDLQQLGLGENWYLGWSSGTPDQSPNAAVESWAAEEKWYNYDENTCAAPPEKTCGHYTQLVWSSTQRLGAGRAVRTTDDGRTYVIWVCNYAPPGNTRGQKPYSVTPGGSNSQSPPQAG
jgi:pathogenesis-related protein 1